jgi:hypothetical protein
VIARYRVVYQPVLQLSLGGGPEMEIFSTIRDILKVTDISNLD